jgi:outer membrane protein assembly factor BamB
MRPRLCVFAFLFAVTAIAVAAGPGDWPQWRGPDRTGISKETGLLQSWPDGGPKLLWKVGGLGGGYSTPSVVDGKIYLMGAKTQPEPKGGGKGGGGKGKGGGGGGFGGGMSYPESVICLDAKGGKELWATDIGKTQGGYPAPRSTPTIDDGHAYAISSNGVIACLDATTGKLIWKKEFKDFDGSCGMWAYAESPLIDGDRVVCTPGGDSATLLCLDKKTGKEVWRASTKGLKAKPREGGFGGGFGGGKGKGGFGKGGGYGTAGYASAVVADLGGTRQYVQYISGGVVGVDANTGKVLWHYDDVGGGQSTLTPIVKDGSVFVSQTKVGSGRAKVSGSGEKLTAEQAYFVSEVKNHHGGMVLVGDHVYGTSDQVLVCLDFKTGEVKWTNRSVGKGSITYADGHLIVRGERGDVALVEATPTEYKEKGRFSQPERSGAQAWPHPVVAGGKLYLRDWDKLLVYDLKAK